MGQLKSFFGHKGFYKEMWQIALPIALQQLISAIVNILDSAMIGQWGLVTLGLGGSEIFSASIMIANRYMITVDNLMVMLAISCTIFIAQYYGAKNFTTLKKVFGTAVILTITFGLVAFAFGSIFSESIIDFFATSSGAGSSMIEYGSIYLTIIVFTFLPYAVSVPITFSLRAVKRTTIPLLASGSAAISNLILNYLFIYLLRLGIQGAAYATIIARLIETTILLVYFFKYKPEFFGDFKTIFTIPKKLIQTIVIKGSPIIIAQILTETLAIFMFFTYARIDAGNATNIAAINLSARVVDLVTAFVGGMGTASIILVGSRLGAGKVQEAKQHARWQLSYIGLISLMTVFLMITLIPIMQFIYQFDVSTNRLLGSVMLIQALSLPFVYYAMNVIFITRAGGFTRAPILITNLPYLFIKLPIVLYFAFIRPEALFQLPFIQDIMAFLGAPLDLIIAIFIVERMIELIRASIAYFVYKFAPWQKDITTPDKVVDNLAVKPI
jgi:putative MATE family efflux protein